MNNASDSQKKTGDNNAKNQGSSASRNPNAGKTPDQRQQQQGGERDKTVRNTGGFGSGRK